MKVVNVARALGVIAAALLCQTAIAAAHGFKDCTKEPYAKWKSPLEAEAAAKAEGYTVSKVKLSGSCYEVYVRDKAGKKFELFYHPIDMTLVKKQEY